MENFSIDKWKKNFLNENTDIQEDSSQKLPFYKWHRVEDLPADLETEIDFLEKTSSSPFGMLLKFENGLIDFERNFYFKGNKEMGREYMVSKFMLVEL